MIIVRCAKVKVNPEDNNKSVFTKGNPQTSNGCIPFGGQTQPIKMEGDKLKWKNAQKKAKKNKISEIINNIIPNRKPFCTIGL